MEEINVGERDEVRVGFSESPEEGFVVKLEDVPGFGFNEGNSEGLFVALKEGAALGFE